MRTRFLSVAAAVAICLLAVTPARASTTTHFYGAEDVVHGQYCNPLTICAILDPVTTDFTASVRFDFNTTGKLGTFPGVLSRINIDAVSIIIPNIDGSVTLTLGKITDADFSSTGTSCSIFGLIGNCNVAVGVMGVNNSFNITLTGDNGVSAYLSGGGTGVWSGGLAPVPAALPLFATGLGALGLLGWVRKRKAQAVA